jgi:hypothetical protein
VTASKRKGLWLGGMAPLGYDSKDRKIIVNEVEAGRVRTIFQSYLRLGSLNLLMAELRQQGIVTKVRTLKTGLVSASSSAPSGPMQNSSGVAMKSNLVVIGIFLRSRSDRMS